MRTGLAGKYDYQVTYSLDSIAGGSSSSETPSGGLSILAAIEKELGLMLEKKKREIDYFVIDHVDKSHAEN